jgi:hypothetical protein
MYARVVTWEGADADAMRESAAGISRRAAEGPPEDVAATGFDLLIDPDHGRALAIVLFDSEADMRRGDAALNRMNPPSNGMGHRTSVGFSEVAASART